MDDLFRAIRESCSPGTWSKGVELARQDAVTGDSETADEIALRVVNPDTGLSAEVSLHPADEEWQCSCSGPDDPCAHVAAAIIAIRRARERGQDLPRSTKAGGKIEYRFTRMGGGLALARVVIEASGETLLTVALSALTSGRVKGPGVAATADDHEVEVALDGHRQGVVPGKVMPRLLKALARGLPVTLDGKPVKLDPTPIGLVAEIVDDGPGVRVTARQDPLIRELFTNAAALTDGALRPVVLPALDPLEQRLLKDGRFFGPMEFGYLASELLPKLESKLPIRIETTKLPRKSHAKPFLGIELTPTGKDESKLRVLPLIVYEVAPDERKVAEVRLGRFYTTGSEVPTRDRDAELQLKDELYRRYRLALDEEVELETAAAIALVESVRRDRDARVSGTGLTRFSLSGDLTAAMSFSDIGFDLTFETAEGAHPGSSSTKGRANADAVIAAWQAGEAFVSLTGGGYSPLPVDWLNRYGTRIADLLAARTGDGALPEVLRPMLADLGDELGAKPSAALMALRERLRRDVPATAFVAPKDLRADLRTYQQVGAAWLAGLKDLGLGALLCDDMGLGKTLQAITALEGPSLVVAPTSVLRNWESELARFRPNLKVSVYHGAGRSLDQNADVIITTYAILRLDIETLTRRKWRVAVLDEAHVIKNPDSQAARAACRIDAEFRIALSGTPVENRLSDLWSQMQFANPGLLGTRSSFESRFARPVAQGDEEAAARLATRVKPFILRRLKREVAPELPPRTEVVRHVELPAAERAIYDSVLLAARRDVMAKLGQGTGVMEALEALLRLRQAACHPSLVPGSGHKGSNSAKLELLLDILTEAAAEGHKALVFSQWTSFLDLIEPGLQAAELPFLRLDGSTTDRADVVARFQAVGGPPVLLMSLKAGGVGLNLTAADHVILTDPWWNPAAEDQAADRAHRIGQDRPVLVQRLVSLGTVEERILALQDRKRALAAAALAGGSGGSISREELLDLIG